MDTANLVNQVRARFKFQEAKLYLQEKYKNKLLAFSQGGVWTITPALIAFLRTAPENTILLDTYDVPIRIITAKLLEEVELVYNQVMDEWIKEWEQLEKIK